MGYDHQITVEMGIKDYTDYEQWVPAGYQQSAAMVAEIKDPTEPERTLMNGLVRDCENGRGGEDERVLAEGLPGFLGEF